MSWIRELGAACRSIVAATRRIFRGPRVVSRSRLALEYARIRLKAAWHRVRDDDGPARVRFLGRRFHTRGLGTFAYLIEEIFVDHCYWFDAVRSDPVILDAGSNVGVSILYFKLLYPDARVIGFEPDPESFRLLRRNVGDGALDRVEVERAAVWDSEGTLTLRSGAAETAGVEATVDPDVASSSGERRVPSVRLSTYVKEIPAPVDLLKMDVEGAELRSLGELRSRSALDLVREVIVECHHNAAIDGLLTGVLRIFEGAGFRYRLRVVKEKPSAAPGTFQDVLVHARRELEDEARGGGGR